jgi:hypothetical protein
VGRQDAASEVRQGSAERGSEERGSEERGSEERGNEEGGLRWGRPAGVRRKVEAGCEERGGGL